MGKEPPDRPRRRRGDRRYERFSNTMTVLPRCSNTWPSRQPLSHRSFSLVVRAATLRPRLFTTAS